MTAPDERASGEPPFGSAGERAKPCPICGKPARDAASAPFCSKRCADVDLHRWLGGVYAVPADEVGRSDVGDEE